ncbi:MAG: extracellular solute-binding protein [Phycisphaerales bacterium]
MRSIVSGAARWMAAALVCAGALASSCSERPGAGAGDVVLYVSADDYVVRPIVGAFEEESGLRVRVLGDTEATKTTGLVQRLRTERENPRADVFWSSEVFLTIRLAEEGLLAPLEDASLEVWPSGLADGDRLWHGFANRARVVVYNTEFVSPEAAPRTMHDLLDERWRGRVGVARPAFGTTRGHMGLALEAWGEDAFRVWAQALQANGVRLYDGNASVVRAVASGEIRVGLTDTDDVWSGQRNGWPIDLVYVRHDLDGRAMGTMVIPNTVAIVDGGPNAEAGRRLALFLLSERVERMLAESDSHNVPIRPEVAADFPAYSVPDPMGVDPVRIAARMDAALAILDDEWTQ